MAKVIFMEELKDRHLQKREGNLQHSTVNPSRQEIMVLRQEKLSSNKLITTVNHTTLIGSH